MSSEYFIYLRDITIDRVNMVKELLDIRDKQLHSILEQNEVNMMLKYVSTFR